MPAQGCTLLRSQLLRGSPLTLLYCAWSNPNLIQMRLEVDYLFLFPSAVDKILQSRSWPCSFCLISSKFKRSQIFCENPFTVPCISSQDSASRNEICVKCPLGFGRREKLVQIGKMCVSDNGTTLKKKNYFFKKRN